MRNDLCNSVFIRRKIDINCSGAISKEKGTNIGTFWNFNKFFLKCHCSTLLCSSFTVELNDGQPVFIIGIGADFRAVFVERSQPETISLTPRIKNGLFLFVRQIPKKEIRVIAFKPQSNLIGGKRHVFAQIIQGRVQKALEQFAAVKLDTFGDRFFMRDAPRFKMIERFDVIGKPSVIAGVVFIKPAGNAENRG